MKPLSSAILCDVSNRLSKGESSRSIGRSLGIGKTTVCNIRKNLNIENKPKNGAPSKLTERDRREIKSLILRGTAKSAVHAANIINQTLPAPISPELVRNVLRKSDLVAKKKIKKPAISEKNRKKRLDWALKHKDWTIEDWKLVIWSDETKIMRYCSDGNRYSWIPKDSKGIASRVQPTLKFGGGSIMIWGCMNYWGVGSICKIEGIMDSSKYQSILHNKLIPFIDLLVCIDARFPENQQPYFQQDNDPKHVSKATKAWLDSKHVKLLEWPPQSPDLNPIEHLWGHLKRKLGERPTVAKGVHELWDMVQEDWLKISREYCQALVESMPRRIQAVIDAKGLQTKY